MTREGLENFLYPVPKYLRRFTPAESAQELLEELRAIKRLVKEITEQKDK